MAAFVVSPATKHLKECIARYGPPEALAQRAVLLGAEGGLALIRQWKSAQQAPKPLAPKPKPQTESLRQQDPTPAPLALKIYPDLAACAVRAGLSSPLRLWHLARTLDTQGRGVVARSDLWAAWRDLGVTAPRQFRNVLRAGEGVLWARDAHDRLFLTGLAAACERLGVAKLACDPVVIPAQVLGDGLHAWHAHLYGAFLQGRPCEDAPVISDCPITRDALAQATGFAPSTQRAYHQVLTVEVPNQPEPLELIERKANYILDPEAAQGDPSAKLERLQALGWDQRGTFVWWDKRGKRRWEKYAARRTGNTYTVDQTRFVIAPRGRVRAANQHLVDLAVFGKGLTAPGQGNDGGEERLYWHNGEDLADAGSKGKVELGFLYQGETRGGEAVRWLVMDCWKRAAITKRVSIGGV